MSRRSDGGGGGRRTKGAHATTKKASGLSPTTSASPSASASGSTSASASGSASSSTVALASLPPPPSRHHSSPDAHRRARSDLSPGLLPPHLQERTRVGKVAALSATGSSSSSAAAATATAAAPFVLYVLRKVLRGHENPALDVAIEAANAAGLPLLVLVLVEEKYAHATARRQTFVLQGVAAAVEELRGRRGLQVAVHVARRGHRQPAALSLSHRAALVVVEEPFCSPWLSGTYALCGAKFGAAVWLVDSGQYTINISPPGVGFCLTECDPTNRTHAHHPPSALHFRLDRARRAGQERRVPPRVPIRGCHQVPGRGASRGRLDRRRAARRKCRWLVRFCIIFSVGGSGGGVGGRDGGGRRGRGRGRGGGG